MDLATSFYKSFEREYVETPLPDGYRKRGFWTQTTLKFLTNLGRKMGYDVLQEKPVRLDMVWFSPEFFEPQIAIEYETNEKTVLDSEVMNLASSSAKLKVLITYAEEGTQQDLLGEIQERWKRRSKRTWDDEFLILLIVFHTEKGYRVFDYFEGHVIYRFGDELSAEELGFFPT